MAETYALIRLAQNAEDVASGLHIFRDQLPRHANSITAAIGELFATSSMLRRFHAAQVDPRFEPSFYRVRNDLFIVFPSLRDTLEACLDMFARSRNRPRQMVFDDLDYRMETEEGLGLLVRLQLYHDLLQDLFEMLSGHETSRLNALRRAVENLIDGQKSAASRRQRRTARMIDTSSASTPRPNTPRMNSYRPIDDLASPTSVSDEWEHDFPPPLAPEPPPLSPTFTSSSSQTLGSSHTSYSNAPYIPINPPDHWAKDAFDGNYPTTTFPPAHQLDDRSVCLGRHTPDALRRLAEEGFVRALELAFDRDSVWIRFYWRPSDSRARILFLTKDASRRDLLYSVPLTQLRLIREKSTLQLCRSHREDGRYSLWARLNFLLYERMVLFYCTFVAMKQQDSRDIPSHALLEIAELDEDEEFGGVVKHGDMLHALRLYRDRSSAVIRLEASPLRGSMQDVPLWTAFVTKYVDDKDWAELRPGGVVSIIALKPPPYVFLTDYAVPQRGHGEFVLKFAEEQDARDFVVRWNIICQNSRR